MSNLLLSEDIGTAKFLSLKETASFLKMSEYQILDRIQNADFPCPISVHVSEGTLIGFSSCEISDWELENAEF